MKLTIEAEGRELLYLDEESSLVSLEEADRVTAFQALTQALALLSGIEGPLAGEGKQFRMNVVPLSKGPPKCP